MNNAVVQTVKKVVAYMCGQENQKIDDWLRNDESSIETIIKMMQILWDQGWKPGEEFSIEGKLANGLANEIYNRAMSYKELLKA